MKNIKAMAGDIYQAKENGFDQAIFAGRMQVHEMRKEALSPNSTVFLKACSK